MYIIIEIYAINVVNHCLTCILVISSFSLDAFEATQHMYAHKNCLNYSVEMISLKNNGAILGRLKGY